MCADKMYDAGCGEETLYGRLYQKTTSIHCGQHSFKTGFELGMLEAAECQIVLRS